MIRSGVPWLCCIVTIAVANAEMPAVAQETAAQLEQVRSFVETHCLDCHTGDEAERGFDLSRLSFENRAFEHANFSAEPWEKMLRRMDTRQMPPPEYHRPDEDVYQKAVVALREILDARSDAFPRLPLVGGMRRMTRAEYQNAVRDLLGVNMDAANLLPADESSHGFDNITVEGLSPTLLNRYLNAAEKISRAAVGGSDRGPVGVTIRIPADRTQEAHVAGLPFGTRGGTVFKKQFTRGGEYEFELKLTRDRDEKVEGLDREHEIDILLDRKRIERFKVVPPPKAKEGHYRDYSKSDAHLRTRVTIPAGTHEIAVTFPHTSASLVEAKRQPFDAAFNRHRHPRRTPALFQVTVVGPLASEADEDGSRSTLSRRLILGEFDPASADRDDAEVILKQVLRRAWRRDVSDADLQPTLALFDRAFAVEGFEPAIEFAVASILVNPNFLFRVESSPPELSPGDMHRLEDFQLASRLSFFLWSSIPDDELLDLASAGRLQNEAVLRQQVTRMLTDPKSQSLIDNFAAQWLWLRNLEAITPNLRQFPDFDDNLRQAFRGETEQLFGDVMRNDLPVTRLIDSPYTFLNERLATHYGVPEVTGSHFRRVDLPANSRRGGILRHGSILMVTSYATRTSPTIRGNWVLENIFGTPAPPPPPNVPNLKENTTLDVTTVRERLAAHRANPACASCHDLIDPVGFSLENYDAVGRWRESIDGLPVDSSGSLPDGAEIRSVADLELGILERPETFVRTLTEKLMTFGLGRAITADDGPAVRKAVDEAAAKDDRFSAVVEAIVCSRPFRERAKAGDREPQNERVMP